MVSPALRAQLESACGGQSFGPRTRETVSTGIEALDSRVGGLPRGAITEIYGTGSSGKTSLMLSVLSAALDRGETCALVDGSDAFSPGARHGTFLWVRCHNLGQALKSTDLILQGGGFGLVVLDVSGIATGALHAVPLSTWFRFQRAIEKTPTILTLVTANGIAGTCAALAIRAAADFRFENRLLMRAATQAEIVRLRAQPKAAHVCCNFYPRP